MDETPKLKRKHWYRLWGFGADSTAERPRPIQLHVHILADENNAGLSTARCLETGEEMCVGHEHYGGKRWGARIQKTGSDSSAFRHFPHCEEKTRAEVTTYVDAEHLRLAPEESSALQRTVTRWFRHLKRLRPRRE